MGPAERSQPVVALVVGRISKWKQQKLYIHSLSINNSTHSSPTIAAEAATHRWYKAELPWCDAHCVSRPTTERDHTGVTPIAATCASPHHILFNWILLPIISCCFSFNLRRCFNDYASLFSGQVIPLIFIAKSPFWHPKYTFLGAFSSTICIDAVSLTLPADTKLVCDGQRKGRLSVAECYTI